MSIKKALKLFQDLVVSGTDPNDAFAQAALKHGVTEKRLKRGMRVDLLSNAEKMLREFTAVLSKTSSEILQMRIEEFQQIIDGLDKEPESPLQVLRRAYSDTISAARNEIDRRKN